MAAPLRALLVGCGGICRAWLNSTKDRSDVQIVGLVDLNPANAEKIATEFGLADALRTPRLAEALEKLRPDIVFDCTIPLAHTEVTTTALQAGCHVLGEKPLADSMANARTSVAAAQATGKLYAVMQNRRYQAAIRSLRQFLDTGAIGRVTTVNADFYIGAHFGGFRDRMEHVLLLDMAIHSFDQGRFIMNADPRSVFCHEWNPSGSWYDHHASAQCIFEMTGGIVFNYRGSWCSEGLNTTWECDWRIVGDKGSVRWDGGGNLQAEVVKQVSGFKAEMEPRQIPVETPSGMESGHKGCILEFLQCVREGGTPLTVCTDNIKSLAMVFGAIESAESGRKVSIGA
ncbi:MAG: oxidoreductase [Lentisphaerae bacterium RIFOXYB12_FULL_65_16]|nr:MAG: oxidoreductase [Lentisphaerae bacterium RIFOXYB12_FULL_65_16]OGV95344.1 MAG: oxidoreductase [Lentisphaerae bacterium RIFOXYB12_FULL_65_16]